MRILICLTMSLLVSACASVKPIEVKPVEVKPVPQEKELTRSEMIERLQAAYAKESNDAYTKGYNDGYSLGFRNGNSSLYGTQPELPPGPRR